MTPALRACPLHRLRLVRVDGADCLSFLQGQLTQDLRTVDATGARYGWTTAQGRLLATGVIAHWQDAFWLTAHASVAAEMVRRLRMYVLRARVDLSLQEAPPVGLYGAASGDTGSGEHGVPWPGDPRRTLLIAADAAADDPAPSASAEDDWGLADIRAGLATVEAATADRHIPQMLNLDLVGGVSFSKGCYIGQEIIARTHHLGRVKRRMYRLTATDGPLPAVNDVVHGEGGEAGRIVAVASAAGGFEVLAVLPLGSSRSPLWLDATHDRALRVAALPYPVPEY